MSRGGPHYLQQIHQQQQNAAQKQQQQQGLAQQHAWHRPVHSEVPDSGSADVGIQSADVDETVFLVVDPHFGVIDDAGYDPVCVCVACVRDYVNIQSKMSNSRCCFYVDARNYAMSELFSFNPGSRSYVPFPIPHDLSSREKMSPPSSTKIQRNRPQQISGTGRRSNGLALSTNPGNTTYYIDSYMSAITCAPCHLWPRMSLGPDHSVRNSVRRSIFQIKFKSEIANTGYGSSEKYTRYTVVS